MPELDDSAAQNRDGQDEKDPLARFRTWRGFLFASIALNVLFVYGMIGAMTDPHAAGWYKALSWLPFNVIASVLYYVFLVKLTQADVDCARASGARSRGTPYVVLCLAMIAANWIALFVA